MSQELAIQAVEAGKNVFITGGAGRGKSWVINKITNKTTVLAAPTGIAALNIGAVTAHKLFKLPIGMPTHADYLKCPAAVKKLFGPDSKVTRIIIDEVGMVRADTLELIDRRLKLARQSSLPFAGYQIIIVGDFFQLEPIVSWKEREHYFRQYSSAFCFTSKAWNFESVLLTKCYRQKDARQARMLDSIRTGDKWCAKALEYIVKEAKPYKLCKDALHLCSFKADAERINSRFYRRAKGEERTFFAHIEGKKTIKWGHVPVDDTVSLKIGVKVLISANCQGGSYVNGDRGEVAGFVDEYVQVKLQRNGAIVLVENFKWEETEYSTGVRGLNRKITGSFEQMPLLLGWAVSQHKAQGMTLDEAAVDVGSGSFSFGQFYMAISRVKDLRNLSFVRPPSINDVMVSLEVDTFYKQLEENTNET